MVQADHSEGSVKGVVLQSRMAFAREQKGEEGVARVTGRLSAEQKKTLRDLLPGGWYPFSLNEAIDRAIADELGIGDRVFLMMGEKSAEQNLGATHRIFVVERDPHGLLKRAAPIYQLYYNTGRREYEKTGEKSAILRTHESKTFSRPDCLTVVGWHKKAIEMCGGKNVRVTEPKCRARGDRVCEYLCEWD